MRLTVDEIRLITVLILIFAVGTVVKHHRAQQHRHPQPPGPPALGGGAEAKPTR